MTKQQLLSYKGYHGSVEYSLEDGVLYGQVVDMSSLISYEGTTITELRTDFERAVDAYLAECAAHNEKPERAYTGSFNVRVTPQLHHELALYAQEHHLSLNASVRRAIEGMVTAG